MDPDLEAGPGQDARERRDVVLVRMHAAGRHQAHDVDGAAARFHFRGEGGERAVGCERAVGDRLVDARQVLHHDAAGAEIHVADFRIAHLPLG